MSNMSKQQQQHALFEGKKRKRLIDKMAGVDIKNDKKLLIAGSRKSKVGIPLTSLFLDNLSKDFCIILVVLLSSRA